VQPVTIRSNDGVITSVSEGSDDSGHRLPGLVIPGLANAHSHAFHRALRARTETGAATFWDWRKQMYAVAGRLDPDLYLALARGVYAEMALAGVTAVGEFHYLHHTPSGKPYDDANAMGEAVMEAAKRAGIRITLLDTCYLAGGFGQPLEGVQVRFGDGDVNAWAERADKIEQQPHARIGAAIHSVRAVPEESIEQVGSWARDRDAPLHFHLSEQVAENEACLAATSKTPTQLLCDHGALGEKSTAVHATHMTDEDVGLLGAAKTCACICPTTERSLADGIGRASDLEDAGCRVAVGSDSHAVIDMFEEARAMELDERLATGRRGGNDAASLLRAATRSGMAALGWQAGEIAAGNICDLVAIDLESPRIAGYRDEEATSWAVFAANASDVTHVVCAGRTIVEDRRHTVIEEPAADLADAIKEVM
jgi:formiminoglutamate deiminase